MLGLGSKARLSGLFASFALKSETQEPLVRKYCSPNRHTSAEGSRMRMLFCKSVGAVTTRVRCIAFSPGHSLNAKYEQFISPH